MTSSSPEVLALIPARGGSKGLPGKNIAHLNGHPLLAYSILAGQRVPAISRMVLSTDDEQIATIGRQYGAEVPFWRPAHLAGDRSTDLEAFQHALQWLRANENYRPDLVLHLRPTTPIRFQEDIERAVQKLWQNPEAESIRSVIESPLPPYKMWRIRSEDEPMEPLLQLEGMDEPYNMPRQALPKVYWHTGTLDVIRPEVILEKRSMSGKYILPLLLDPAYIVDIDTQLEFELAERLMASAPCLKF